MQPIIKTERLNIRHLDEYDAPFILQLLNDPDFIQFIGDKQVRNLDDARRYLQEGPLKSYQEHGFGLFMVEQHDTGKPVGLCGVLRRPQLDAPDLGYAFLPDFRGQGYAREAAAATLDYAHQQLNTRQLLAITSADNVSSIRLLEKLGFQYAGLRAYNGDEKVKLFQHQWD